MVMANKSTKIAIIGAGMVGATTAYTLLLHERVNELVLVDTQYDKAFGQSLDLSHGLPFVGHTKIRAGGFSDCQGADIVLITAGTVQRVGETRQDLLERNADIIESITEQVVRYNQDGILLIATNPVDVLSYMVWKQSGFPWQRVIGSGTVLDSARFRFHIGESMLINSRNINAYIIGEHGDTSVPVWSQASVAGMGNLTISESQRAQIYEQTRDAAYQVIQSKGATYYAIALALDQICRALLKDESTILPVSTLLSDYYGVSDVYLSVPCILDRRGVRKPPNTMLSHEEIQELHKSSAFIKEQISRACRRHDGTMVRSVEP